MVPVSLQAAFLADPRGFVRAANLVASLQRATISLLMREDAMNVTTSTRLTSRTAACVLALWLLSLNALAHQLNISPHSQFHLGEGLAEFDYGYLADGQFAYTKKLDATESGAVQFTRSRFTIVPESGDLSRVEDIDVRATMTHVDIGVGRGCITIWSVTPFVLLAERCEDSPTPEASTTLVVPLKTNVLYQAEAIAVASTYPGEHLTDIRFQVPAEHAVELIVDDGSSNYRKIASNIPTTGNVWNSLAQSFTAEDAHIRFGFRLTDDSSSLPNAGASIVYNLYSGENSYSTLLASRAVVLPGVLSDDPRAIYGDVGFVEADFSSVALVPGQRYTVQVTVPAANLPPADSETGIGVWTSLNDPYAGGRFFFPLGYDNSFFAEQDMLFRVVPVELSPVQATSVLENSIIAQDFPKQVSASLLAPLKNVAKVLGDDNPDNDASACGKLDDFISTVEDKVAANKIDEQVGVEFILQAEALQSKIGCQ